MKISDSTVSELQSLSSDEAAAIAEITRLIRHQVEEEFASGKRPARRDQHPKAHGCVKATFTVLEGLPTELRHGLFAAPRSYDAWIRFSSSSVSMQSDAKRDAHGMAIKLVGVPGETLLAGAPGTQDFVLANNNVFFIRSAADYVRFVSAFTSGHLLRFFVAWNPFRWKVHEFTRMLKATRHTVTNPLQVRYWSQTPYRLGPEAVKYSARPVSPVIDAMPASPGEMFLRQAMIATLQREDVSFDFMVQRQVDPVRMPIEDPTIEWRESLSRFEPVARIHIPRQAFDFPERDDFAEHLSFNPWRVLPDHEPLGHTNRIRRVVYDQISHRRHELNGMPEIEPVAQRAR